MNVDRNPSCFYEDEIDLYELWLTLKKRKVTIFVVTLIFTVIGLSYSLLTTPIYLSDSTILLPEDGNSTIISFASTKKIIKRISNTIEEKDYKKLKELLKIKKPEIISAISVSQERNEKKTFSLSIYCREKDAIPEIRAAILDYLNRNDYVKNEIENDKETIKEEIKTLSGELPKLTKLADDIDQRIKNDKTLYLNFNPLDVNTKILEIKNRIVELRSKLYNKIHPYEIISTYTSDKPVKPKKLLITVVSFISGLFTGIFAAFFKEWLETAKKEHKPVDKEE